MEDPHRRSAGSAGRRLRGILALAGDYLKYLFMKRRRLMHRVARRTLALVHRHHGGGRRKSSHQCPWPARALMEREFSCADSPSPAFLATKRLLLRSRQRGGGAAAAVSSCFGSFRAPCGSPETAAPSSEAEAAAVEEDRLTEDDGEEDDDDDEVLAGDVWAQCGGELLDVDDRAEEFINMFYEQLRAQSFAAAVFQRSP